jgi:hypothetical protein
MGATIASPFVVAADWFGDRHPEKPHPAARIGHLLAVPVEIGVSLVT